VIMESFMRFFLEEIRVSYESMPSRGFLFYSAFGCKNRVEQRSVVT
jgi:hypothetical protein